MIYLLFGEDELSLQETLTSIKNDVGPDELRDVNITKLNGDEVKYDELTATCDTVPFLSDKRLVIVEGLLGRLTQATSRAGGRDDSRQSKSSEWDGLLERLSAMPPTTVLVFVEGRLNTNSALVNKLRPLADVRSFPLPGRNDLRGWIADRAAKLRVDIEPGAVNTLAETIGNDVRVIDMELQKLALYRWGGKVRQQDVEDMVSYVKEASIFEAVDAALGGQTGRAIQLVHNILDAGRPPSYLITMIARQVRLLLLAKDLKQRRVPSVEMGQRLRLSGYPLRKTLEQESKFPYERLVYIHRKLLEADLSVKTSGVDEQLVLDMLIGELATSVSRA